MGEGGGIRAATPPPLRAAPSSCHLRACSGASAPAPQTHGGESRDWIPTHRPLTLAPASGPAGAELTAQLWRLLPRDTSPAQPPPPGMQQHGPICVDPLLSWTPGARPLPPAGPLPRPPGISGSPYVRSGPSPRLLPTSRSAYSLV